MLNTSIGNYRMISHIGEGGMGAVYLARHTLLGRRVAVKVLLPELSNNREIVARFFNEARAATAIRHPGIVEIHDFGFLPDSRAYIMMEFLEGESLRSRLRREGRMPATMALTLVRQIAGALHAAHESGIVHRDLKPDNVFLVCDPEIPGGERIKLLDFGIAKLTGAGSRTLTDVVMGTPAYMAPEQCRSTANVDARADLYALGCIVYELVCGRPPFVGDEVMAQQLHSPPHSPTALARGLPEPVERLILSLLEKDPTARPATAIELIAAIDRAAAAIAALHGVRATTWPRVVENAVATPTTISGAAGARITPQPRRSRWLAAAASTVVGAAAVAVWMGAREGCRGSSDLETRPAAAPSAIAPAATPDAAAAPDARPAPDATPDAAPPIRPAVVHLSIESDPPGANVFLDGRIVGTTPFSETATRDSGARAYTVRKKGFQPAKVTIGTGRDGSERVHLRELVACPASVGPGTKDDRGLNPFCK